MKQNKIYISGKISGLDLEEATKLFETVEHKLSLLGWDVVNPITIPHAHDLSWESYMKNDIKALMDCQAIYMLNNWTESKGAKVEHDIAQSLNIPCFYEKDGFPSYQYFIYLYKK